MGSGVRQNLNFGELSRIQLIEPPLEEQRKIAAYLNNKSLEIQQLQSSIEQQIEILEAYKRSVITETVTKGLDPSVPTKDSGIPWIGTIPSLWQEKPIRVLFQEVTLKNIDCRYSNSLKFTYGKIVPKEGFYPDGDDYVEKTIMKYTVVKPGVIMINGLNLNFDFVSRRVGLVEDNGVITSAYIAIDPVRSILNPRFAMYALKSWDFRKAFHNMGGGVRKILNFAELGKKHFAFPDLAEQQRIVDFLNQKVSGVDGIIETKRRQLEVLADYRKSLIFEYVTGKKEVPV